VALHHWEAREAMEAVTRNNDRNSFYFIFIFIFNFITTTGKQERQ
jgi:hypothetical protein